MRENNSQKVKEGEEERRTEKWMREEGTENEEVNKSERELAFYWVTVSKGEWENKEWKKMSESEAKWSEWDTDTERDGE